MTESRPGVRAPIVAMKRRNGRGAKGAQEGGCVKDSTAEDNPAPVPSGATQAGDIRARWAWVEPLVWTERMLAALENGVKGGRWFSLIDKVYSANNLRSAFAKVKKNRGAAGVDHQTVEMFEARLEENLRHLAESLRTETYRPGAIRRVYIPKPGTKAQRPLGIPTVRDRVAQAAVRHVLEPIFERDYAAHSYGFRPGRGCKDALRQVDGLLKSGHTWVVDADLQSYFDTIPHGRLMDRVQAKVADGRVIRLIEAYLKADVMDVLSTWEPEEGCPQGAVITPPTILQKPPSGGRVKRGRINPVDDSNFLLVYFHLLHQGADYLAAQSPVRRLQSIPDLSGEFLQAAGDKSQLFLLRLLVGLGAGLLLELGQTVLGPLEARLELATIQKPVLVRIHQPRDASLDLDHQGIQLLNAFPS